MEDRNSGDRSKGHGWKQAEQGDSVRGAGRDGQDEYLFTDAIVAAAADASLNRLNLMLTS